MVLTESSAALLAFLRRANAFVVQFHFGTFVRFKHDDLLISVLIGIGNTHAVSVSESVLVIIILQHSC